MDKANKPATETSNAAPETIAAMYAGSACVTVFWVLIILKESYEGISDLLNFYKPVGPLLGLFLLALVMFALVYYWAVSFLGPDPSVSQLRKHQSRSSKLFVAASVLVFFMTFPPIFDVFVDLLKNK